MVLNTEEDGCLAQALNSINDGKLRGWDREFITDVRTKYEEEGSEIFVSGKMWKNIRRIYRQATGEELW